MLAGIIFENIQDYGLLHSSPQILDAVIEGTRLGLPSVKNFIESRMITCEHPLLPFSQRRLSSKFRRTAPSIKGDYGV